MSKRVKVFWMGIIIIGIIGICIYRGNESRRLIKEMVHFEDTNDWFAFASLWCEQEKDELINMFDDPDAHTENRGILTVSSAELLHMWKLNNSEYAETSFFYQLEREFKGIEIYLIEVDNKVRKVTDFFNNGGQFFVVFTGMENGDRKILAMHSADLGYVKSKIDGVNNPRLQTAYQEALEAWQAQH